MTTQSLTNAVVDSSYRLTNGEPCFTSIHFTDVEQMAYLWTEEEISGQIEISEVTENPHTFTDGNVQAAYEFFLTIANHGRAKTNIITDLKLIERYRSLILKWDCQLELAFC